MLRTRAKFGDCRLGGGTSGRMASAPSGSTFLVTQSVPDSLQTSYSIMSQTKNVPSIHLVTSEVPSYGVSADWLAWCRRSRSSCTSSEPDVLYFFPDSCASCVSHIHGRRRRARISQTLPLLVNFKTTTNLRCRNPGDGLSSLQTVQRRRRRNSAASFQTVTKPGHAPVPPSSATPFTTTKDSVDRGDGNDAPSIVYPDDDRIDPTPFCLQAFCSRGPQDAERLREDRDLQGLCIGLGTSPITGLSAHPLGQAVKSPAEKVPLRLPFPIANKSTASTLSQPAGRNHCCNLCG